MRTLAKKAKRSKQPVHPKPAITAPLAFTPDGQVFINAAECKGRNLEGRSQFVVVLMTAKEARFARKAIDDAASAAASRIAARMPMKKTVPNTGTATKTAPSPKSHKSEGNPGQSSGSGAAS